MSKSAVINILQELDFQGVVVEDMKNCCKLIVYYPDDISFEKKRKSLLVKLDKLKNLLNDFLYNINISEIEEKDWSTSWFKYFDTIEIGSNFVVLPEWNKDNFSDKKVIKIYPEQAFGIGSHESTQLAVKLLEDELENKVIEEEFNLLDIGCGTGILSIAAAKLGVKNILAIDKDKKAVKAAQKNSQLNKEDDIIEVRKVDFKKGLSEKDKFNIVIANLLPEIIYDLLPIMVNYVKRNNILICSGIIEEKEPKIISRLEENNLSILKKFKQNKWLGFKMKRG